MLVLDASYSLEAIRSRKMEDSITCRDLDGFFKHVWTVHLFASLVTSKSWGLTYGKPAWYTLAPAHTFIEGKVGRYAALRWVKPLNFIFSQAGIFFTLYRLIRKEKISVIRVGDPLYLGMFGWLLARLCRIPIVVRIGGNYDKICETTGHAMMPRIFFSRKIEKKFERFILSRADLVAGANQDNLDFALRNGARPEYSTLFRYGNLINKFHFIEPYLRKDGISFLQKIEIEPYKFLLYIGRLESVKHPEDILKVLAEVRDNGYNMKAVLVGDGESKNLLINLSKKLGIEDQVVLCGNRDQEWLANVIPLAAVVVSPHTGRALLEAALGGAAIVAYDIDWQSELITTGLTGELVPYLDWEKMAESVTHFLNDVDYCATIKKAVRKKAMEMMDPTMLNEHERNQYLLLLNRTEKKRKR